MKTEEWRHVLGGLYEVSNMGGIRRSAPGRRTWAGRPIKPVMMNIGYWKVSPVVNGRNVQMLLHRLVAEAFLGPCQDGFEVNHIDGDKSNASASNLEYISHKENYQHAKSIGLIRDGERHPNAKLTDHEVREIRAARSRGESGVSVAKRFGVSGATVSEIIHGTKRRSA